MMRNQSNTRRVLDPNLNFDFEKTRNRKPVVETQPNPRITNLYR